MPKAPKARPARIYKYRAFSELSLQSLIEDKLFFADPSTFNDPLDAKPTLDADLPADDLDQILRKLVERRVIHEMSAAAKTIGYGGPRTVEHIEKHARRTADDLLAEVRFSATDPDYDDQDDALQFLLGQHVQEELLRRYERGIVSFAERAECPLMWSHYGDQHKGICIGYSAPGDVKLEPVGYGGTRSIKSSLVKAMVDGDAAAGRQVDNAVLRKKAFDWRYEREWRLIGERGLRDSPLELEEVVFGMRCPLTVRFIVATALAKRRPTVHLSEIRQRRGTFLLRKAAADVDELLATWPRRARSILEAFADITLPPDTAN